MISTIVPLRRLAVTLALTGATTFGAVALAPAALADEPGPAPVVEAPVVEAPVVEAPAAEAPVVEAPVVEVPVAEAPVVESVPAPAPVVVPSSDVVIGKDGKPVKAPKVCSTSDLEKLARKVEEAEARAAKLDKAAAVLRQCAAVLRAQAADQLVAQGVALVAKARVPTTCTLPLPGGGRF